MNDIISKSISWANIPAHSLQETGLVLPDSISEEQCESILIGLQRIGNARQWWLGDWWKAANKYGNGQALCEKHGLNYGTITQNAKVAGQIEICRRRQNLSYSHHAEVCPLETPEEQDYFLDWCLCDPETGEQRGKRKTRDELREAVQNYINDQSWSDSERERRIIVEQGGTVVANMHGDTDKYLLIWAKTTGVFQAIDRKTKWGNPFEMPKDGNRDAVCDKYAIYFDLKTSLHGSLDELRGKVLGCWCHPDRCHGEELIRRLSDES